MNLKYIYKGMRQEFEEYSNAQEAHKMSEYMRNKFSYYGIKAPVRKELMKPYIVGLKGISGDDLHRLGKYCWDQEEREWQYAFLDIVKRYKKALNTFDFDCIEGLLIAKPWWDTVDLLATHGVAEIFAKDKKLRDTAVQKWRNQDNIWLIRTALIFQMHRKNDMDFELIKSLVLQYSDNDEFFIQKAAGWILRSYSKRQPKAVRGFVNAHPELSALCKREALKWMTRKTF